MWHFGNISLQIWSSYKPLKNVFACAQHKAISVLNPWSIALVSMMLQPRAAWTNYNFPSFNCASPLSRTALWLATELHSLLNNIAKDWQDGEESNVFEMQRTRKWQDLKGKEQQWRKWEKGIVKDKYQCVPLQNQEVNPEVRLHFFAARANTSIKHAGDVLCLSLHCFTNKTITFCYSLNLSLDKI